MKTNLQPLPTGNSRITFGAHFRKKTLDWSPKTSLKTKNNFTLNFKQKDPKFGH